MSSVKKKRELDLTAFPPGTVTEYSTLVCLACTFDIFTTQLGLAPRTAYSEIKKYLPTVAELTAASASPPFFDSVEKNPHCPYCNSAKRWHAYLDTIRIEGGKASDAARRALVKTLPAKDNQFQVIEAKTDKRAAFFHWLEELNRGLENLDDTSEVKAEDGGDAWGGGNAVWLLGTTRAYLLRLEPKTDWEEVFKGVRAVRRSSRLTVGWEKDSNRLFLAPVLYHEILIVQYLVSRSHVHGGRTLEGRLTLPELIRRLRYGGYLDARGIPAGDQFETLDRLIDSLAGGVGTTKVYHIVDRTDFLEKVKSVYARYAS